jgi:predicted DNA binding CopG/RHH family protein
MAKTNPATRQRSTVDEAGGLRMITLRADRAVIEEIKVLATQRGWPYQALIRRILKSYVDSSHGDPSAARAPRVGRSA